MFLLLQKDSSVNLKHSSGLISDSSAPYDEFKYIYTRYTVRGRGAKRRTSSDLTTTYLTRLWSKTMCVRLVTYARSRHIAENFQKVQYQAWSGGYMFLLTSCKKSSKRVPKTGPWTGWYQVLTFLRAVHFWILEHQELNLPVDSSSEAAFCSPS